MSIHYKIVAIAILAASAGCTSFRTTVLTRFGNDSVAPQQTNRKLKGLPVKLKVPSHVLVTISEQQVLLANAESDVDKVRKAAQVTVDAKKANIKAVKDAVDEADASLAEKLVLQQTAAAAVAAATNDVDRATAQAQLKTTTKNVADAQIKKGQADLDAQSLPAMEQDLIKAVENLKDVLSTEVLGYRLISFDPAQYVVRTELQYTDKVFLVDFKRPAGGILDLKEASMDDEQYFSKVQAEVTEQTLADISTALNTLSGPLGKLKSDTSKNKAIATSSSTPDEAANKNVDFQESLVAMQRIDISEPNWEVRVSEFVNAKLSQLNPQNAMAPGEMVPADAQYFSN